MSWAIGFAAWFAVVVLSCHHWSGADTTLGILMVLGMVALFPGVPRGPQ